MILVVNADDAGVDPPRNAGILEAARRGVVRSASLLASFPAAASFAAGAASVPRLDVGLHFNVTEGAPLVAGHRSLVGGDGSFPGKRETLRRALAGLLDEREAARELEAQWELAARLLGRAPTHTDGHNHAHVFPGIAAAVARCLPDRHWVRRVPAAAPWPAGSAAAGEAGDPYSSPAALRSLLASLGEAALAAGWGKFRAADRFAGLELVGGYDAAELEDWMAREAPASGTVELMTHPGRSDPASVPFSRDSARERELAALCDPRVAAAAAAAGVRLLGFGDLL